ncbi:hypothetical protein PHYSODRAFT_515885 [Phytophthora sojae]|uniref:Histone-lysine N-methyltransferase, H3 lysine-79 specific n=1 Tax=Phytophthora sojae (strain P6497) TaxID=1094619 RepID=G4ZVH3_PHYSP|nr:hypothetical protein PHYSODRAFT_515885 [Phytophthora sojae]EGZ11491.1 hypothetical protein PHYSODRAFT_515885 [Phytophthora sojae]|eukprot:XP_009531824.1 hypothetical protein PHYSODRAFT_515885 [Phytophthora sojae]
MESLVSSLFAHVKGKDVRQLSGCAHFNAGETTFAGVKSVVDHLRLTPADVFVDIGSGIGNVVVQVALEASAKVCVGIEVRGELVEIAEDIVRQHGRVLPQLSSAMVLFSNNKLFEETANQALQDLACQVNHVSRVVVMEAFCPRHRQSCQRLFCALFGPPILLGIVVTWTSNVQNVYCYKKITTA